MRLSSRRGAGPTWKVPGLGTLSESFLIPPLLFQRWGMIELVRAGFGIPLR